MKRILIGCAELLTGDAFGDALLDYALILGRTGASGVATLPVVDDAGESARARLLLGPGTPLVVLEARSAHPEPDDAEALAELRLRARPVVTIAESAPVDDDFDVFALPGEWVDAEPAVRLRAGDAPA